jgi:hypothetical protein
VDVAFTDGRQGRYDLVVGADGLHSNVRKLAFGPEKDYVRHFGYYVSLVDLPNDREWQRGMLSVPGLAIAVRDAGDGPQGMMLAASAELDYDYRDLDAQRRMIADFLVPRRCMAGARVARGVHRPAAKGFYFDSVSQTHMPSWIKGNVAVIGDAGHCAALLSGMGTTLGDGGRGNARHHWTEHDGDTARCITDLSRAPAALRRAMPGLCAGRCADHGAADPGGARRAQRDFPGVSRPSSQHERPSLIHGMQRRDVTSTQR